MKTHYVTVHGRVAECPCGWRFTSATGRGARLAADRHESIIRIPEPDGVGREDER
jgi:hypothetical protein